jgi:hypothetical protein
MSTKKIKISKNKKKQKSIGRTFVLFFWRSSHYFIRLQVVGAVILIHTVYRCFLNASMYKKKLGHMEVLESRKPFFLT